MFPAQRQSGKVRVVKGFMGFANLESFLHDNEDWLASQPVNFHFRWRTHGQTDAANTHPYPITRDHRRLTQLDIVVPYAVMHNGVIPAYLAPADPFFSDTAIFVRDRVARRRGKRKMLVELRRTPGYNKFALMDGTGHTTLVGQFTSPTSANGHWVSNTSYAMRTQTWTPPYSAALNNITTCRALPPPTTPWTGAPHYGQAAYGDYADGWWGNQAERERRFLREAGWQRDEVEEQGECEKCGERATCLVYGMVLCVRCMQGVVDGEGEEEGVLTCPEGVA